MPSRGGERSCRTTVFPTALISTIDNSGEASMRYILATFVVGLLLQALRAGDETPQAVKDLLEKVKSGDGRAAVAIVAYGKAAVPGLIAVLEDTNTLAQ